MRADQQMVQTKRSENVHADCGNQFHTDGTFAARVLFILHFFDFLELSVKIRRQQLQKFLGHQYLLLPFAFWLSKAK